MEDNFGYLFAGFAIGWAVFMGLAYWIYRRLVRVEQEIEEVRHAHSSQADD